MGYRSRPGVLELDKEGDRTLQIRASDDLPTGVTLTGVPTIRIDRLTVGSEPDDWDDVTVEFSVSGHQVVDSIADNGTTLLGTDQAVQFTIAADADTLPDETDEPVPGDNYRIVVVCSRSDGVGDWVGKVPLIIHY